MKAGRIVSLVVIMFFGFMMLASNPVLAKPDGETQNNTKQENIKSKSGETQIISAEKREKMIEEAKKLIKQAQLLLDQGNAEKAFLVLGEAHKLLGKATGQLQNNPDRQKKQGMKNRERKGKDGYGKKQSRQSESESKLTQEQRAKLKEAMTDFEKTVKAYVEKNGKDDFIKNTLTEVKRIRELVSTGMITFDDGIKEVEGLEKKIHEKI